MPAWKLFKSQNTRDGVFTRVQAALERSLLSLREHLTDYVLLAGRSGGQTICGGTGPDEDLTLCSTSDDDLGTITLDDLLYVESPQVGVNTDLSDASRDLARVVIAEDEATRPALTVRTASSNGADVQLEIQGGRNASPSIDTAQLLFTDWDDNKSGGEVINLARISGRMGTSNSGSGTLNIATHNGSSWNESSIYIGTGGGVLIKNTSSTSPDASAVLTLTSTDRGFLPPRLTTTQRNNISGPTAGLTIFNTTTTKLEVYDGTTWQVCW